MSLNGSGATTGIFPMIWCAKLGGLFENSKSIINSFTLEHAFEQNRKSKQLTTLNMEYDIWIDSGRRCSD